MPGYLRTRESVQHVGTQVRYVGTPHTCPGQGMRAHAYRLSNLAASADLLLAPSEPLRSYGETFIGLNSELGKTIWKVG